MELNDRELAAVLTGLRLLQNYVDEFGTDATMIQEFINEGDEPLSSDEVDDLCERLNMEAQ